ncbi:MAG: hypothetical protein QOI55_36, partial [Actinomycetota bacterium]|nr:hypothetical protein [Actinomycetota bacterium]
WGADRYGPRVGRTLSAVALVALAAVSGVNTVAALRAGTPGEPASSIVATLTPQLLRAVERGRGDVIVAPPGNFYALGILLALERHGVPARVTDDRFHLVGDGRNRVHRGGAVRAALFVGVDGSLDQWYGRPDLELVAYWGTMPIRAREQLIARIDKLRAPIEAAHKARRMTDREYLERLDRLPAIPRRSGTINTAVGVFMQRQTPSG